MAELPRVASNFFIHCNKCDQERYHKVLTHTSSTSAKMECEVCHTKKNYTLSKGSNVAKKTRTRKAKSAEAVLGEANEKYRSLIEKVGEGKVEPYRMSNTYEVDAKIEHPKFGVGVVVGSFIDKIEVVFEDSSRQLVQNRK